MWVIKCTISARGLSGSDSQDLGWHSHWSSDRDGSINFLVLDSALGENLAGNSFDFLNISVSDGDSVVELLFALLDLFVIFLWVHLYAFKVCFIIKNLRIF